MILDDGILLGGDMTRIDSPSAFTCGDRGLSILAVEDVIYVPQYTPILFIELSHRIKVKR